jgi:hypothetical protein
VVSGIFHSVIDALVGQQTDRFYTSNADFAQEIVEVG